MLRCKKPVTAEKQFTLHNAPAALTIHLKRFSPLGRKIGHHLHYEDRISLRTLMSEGQYGSTYSLYGVICHSGGGPNSGHYLAHVRGRDGWYEMNDEIVTRNYRSPTSLKSAYMLFYMKDKGQALEAAIMPTLDKPSMRRKSAAVVGSMKKRRIVQSDDEEEDSEDKGIRTTRPLIGPRLPSPSPSPTSDPQAAQLKKKIDAARRPPEALLGLSQYASDDENGQDGYDKDASCKPNGFQGTPQTANHSPLRQLPTSPSSKIPTSSFYASAAEGNKKRKNPNDNWDDSFARQPLASRPNMPTSPLSFSSINRSGITNPFNRMKGNNLRANTRTYGRQRRMGI
jgi:ubiquitin carboxyl-terminal hydrolase 36/42